MKFVLVALGMAASLGGCAYRDPYQSLLQQSLSQVEGYAASVKAALVAQTPQQVMERGKEAIRNSLKDPSSAQFRNVRLMEYLDGVVICGDVNAKNSFGGYIGFTNFVSGTSSGFMRSSDADKYAEITIVINTGLDRACSGKPYSPSNTGMST